MQAKHCCRLIALVCVLQNVPYVFVPSKAALGRACGVARPVSPFIVFYAKQQCLSMVWALTSLQEQCRPMCLQSCQQTSVLSSRLHRGWLHHQCMLGCAGHLSVCDNE